MERICRSNALEMCRLCGKYGNHKKDIVESEHDIAENDANHLCDKIFRCVGVQVNEWLFSSVTVYMTMEVIVVSIHFR